MYPYSNVCYKNVFFEQLKDIKTSGTRLLKESLTNNLRQISNKIFQYPPTAETKTKKELEYIKSNEFFFINS